jgi:16S rRNA (cytidine1402-2'-O)-methyltransferase
MVTAAPIGNMGDFSFRAVEVLKSVALVLAEDTRHSRHLLDHYAIETPLAAHHEHNESRSLPGILARLESGESIALISDAGTPLISDPGERLVRAALRAGARVVPVPGASALLAALVSSGLASDRFTFLGFLPRKGKERRAVLDSLARLDHTAILYEAPPRLADTLAELAALSDPDREAVVARELTKRFEEVRRGTVSSLAAYYKGSLPRGEIVIVLDRAPERQTSEDALRPRVAALRAEGRDARDIVRVLMDEGASRNVAYRLVHDT